VALAGIAAGALVSGACAFDAPTRRGAKTSGKPSRRRFAARTGEDRSTDRAGLDGVHPAPLAARRVKCCDELFRDAVTLAKAVRGFKRILRRRTTEIAQSNHCLRNPFQDVEIIALYRSQNPLHRTGVL
jgi:hypothetical protein